MTTFSNARDAAVCWAAAIAASLASLAAAVGPLPIA
jgi:hypothetical protein